MRDITINDKEYLLVEIPKANVDFYNFSISEHGNLFGINNITKEKAQCDLYLNLINFQVVGKMSDIINNETICSGLVKSKKIKESWNDTMSVVYPNYQRTSSLTLVGKYCTQASDSVISYLENISLDLKKQYLMFKNIINEG